MRPGPYADKTEWRYWAKLTRAKLPDVSERLCSHLEQFLNDLCLETGRTICVLAYRALPDEIRLGSLGSSAIGVWRATSVAAPTAVSICTDRGAASL